MTERTISYQCRECGGPISPVVSASGKVSIESCPKCGWFNCAPLVTAPPPVPLAHRIDLARSL